MHFTKLTLLAAASVVAAENAFPQITEAPSLARRQIPDDVRSWVEGKASDAEGHASDAESWIKDHASEVRSWASEQGGDAKSWAQSHASDVKS